MIALRLFHGRTTPDEQLEDWGKDGPVFILNGLHVTYLATFFGGIGNDDTAEFETHKDLFYYDDIYYGDIEIMSAEYAQEHYKDKIQKFNPVKAKCFDNYKIEADGYAKRYYGIDIKDMADDKEISKFKKDLETAEEVVLRIGDKRDLDRIDIN